MGTANDTQAHQQGRLKPTTILCGVSAQNDKVAGSFD
jgi:hypothetical protein